MPSGNIKHGKNIIELKPMYSIFKCVQSPQFGAFGARDMDNAPFCLGWSLITEPFVMIPKPFTREYNQYLFFVGGDPANVYESFDGEVEFGMDGVMQSITYPACIFIPAGTLQGPYTFKRVSQPMMFIDVVPSASMVVQPAPPGSLRGE